jgi:hypothetical protein
MFSFSARVRKRAVPPELRRSNGPPSSKVRQKLKRKETPFCFLIARAKNEPTGFLEEHQGLRTESRHPKKNYPSSPPAFVCEPSTGPGSRFAVGTDAARTCRHLHHTDLYPRDRRETETGPQTPSPKGIRKGSRVRGYKGSRKGK